MTGSLMLVARLRSFNLKLVLCGLASWNGHSRIASYVQQSIKLLDPNP